MPSPQLCDNLATLFDPHSGDWIVFGWYTDEAIASGIVSLRFVSESGSVINEWTLERKVARELWSELVKARGWTRKS